MNHFTQPPGREVYNGSKEENEIRKIFYDHWEKMRDQMTTEINQIESWRDECIAHINKYADQQIQILKDDYDRQRHVFDDSRRANIDTATAYVCHATKQTKLFDQLRDACLIL